MYKPQYFNPNRLILRAFSAFFALLIVTVATFSVPTFVAAADTDCKTTSKTFSTGATYTAEICLDAPASGTQSGQVVVTGRIASFSETHPSGGATPTIGRLEFFLAPASTVDPSTDNGTALKADAIFLNGSFKQSGVDTYSFTLNTDDYKDVTDWEIWATATVRVSGTTGMKGDYYWTDPDRHTVTLSNSNPTDPVNTNTFTPVTPNPSGDMVVAVTGDGGASDGNGLDVGNLMAGWNPNMMMFLGDVYWSGTYQEFSNWYHPQLGVPGSLKSVTNPVIGNHEYQATGPIGKNGEGYFNYWNNPPQFYSYDAKGWHFIGLNTNTSTIRTITGNTGSSYDNGGPSGVGRMTDTSKNWRTNQFVNQTITVGGQRIYIVSNTNNQLTLQTAWSSVPSNNTAYTINGGTEMATKWLTDDLAANQDKCIIAYAHHPRFTIGGHADEATDAKQGWAWNKLVDGKVTAYLVGHEHSYQRWNPIGVAGDTTKYETQSAGGVTQLLVGTGGHAGTGIVLSDSRVAQSWGGSPTNTNAGAMKLLVSPNTLTGYMYKLSDTTTPADTFSISCKGTGSISGQVTAGGQPLAGATVSYAASYADEIAPSPVIGSVTTDSSGNYSIVDQPALNYTLTVTKAGHDTEVVQNVAVVGAATTTQNVVLESNIGVLTGTVTDAGTNAAVSGVTVSATGLTDVTTDANGVYTFTDVLAGTYTVTASKSGYATKRAAKSVTVGTTATQDFALPQVIFTDSFESGDLSNWTTNNNMVAQQSSVVTGAWASSGTTTGTATNLRKTLGATYQSLNFRSYFNVQSQAAGSGLGLVSFRNGSDGAIIKTYLDGTTNKLCIRNEVTLTNTCSNVMPSQNAWHSIELQTIVNGTASTHKVWLDGAEVTALTSTAANLGTSNIGRIVLGEVNGGRTFTVYFDDAAVYNAYVGGIVGSVIGTVRDSMTNATISDVSLSYTGGTATSNASGTYQFLDVPVGTISVEASKTGYTTQSQNVLVNTDGSVTKDFTLVPTTGAVSGTITNTKTAAAVSGATVTYSGGTASTDSSGLFTLSGVQPGTYLLTVTKTGYTPRSVLASVTAGSITTSNLAIAEAVFADDFETGTMSKWTTNNNLTVQGTTVHFGTKAAEGNTTTLAMNARKTLGTTYNELYYRANFNLKSQAAGSAVGLLSLRNASDGGIMKLYIDGGTDRKLCLRNEITASNTCSTVIPAQNAWHTLELRGLVNGTTSTHQVWLDGTEVTALGSTSANLGTNPIGRIHLGEVNANRTYHVVFDDVLVQESPIGQAGGVLTGKVTDAQSSANLSGATVTVGSKSATTDSNGDYVLADLEPGEATATVTKSGYSQLQSTVSLLADTATTYNAGLTGNNIGSITGTVTDEGTAAPVSGVTVSYSGGTATTNGSGVYTLSGVAADTYTVTVTKTGYVTKTASVTVTAGQSTTQDFAMPQLFFNDTFEAGNLSAWTSATNMTAQQTVKHDGSWAVEGTTTNGNTNVKKTLGTTTNSAYYRTYLYIDSQAAGSNIALNWFKDSADTALVKLYVDGNTNKLCLRNEVTASNVCSNSVVSQDAWHSVELHAVINGTSSTHEVWLDGAAVTSLNSTTANLGTNPIGRIQLGESSTGRTYSIFFDDVVVQNTQVGQ